MASVRFRVHWLWRWLLFCISWAGTEETDLAVLGTSAGGQWLKVTYNVAMQPLVEISIAGQKLPFVFDASSANTVVFVKELRGCTPPEFEACYSFNKAVERGFVHLCKENDAEDNDCKSGQGSKYACVDFLPNDLEKANAHNDGLVIDGITYIQEGVEALDAVSVMVDGIEHKWLSMPVRLLKGSMETRTTFVSPRLFECTSGILGASGPTLGCRNETLWYSLLNKLQVKRFALDFQPPEQAILNRNSSLLSKILFNGAIPEGVLWSQPKQTGDFVNDGMYEFLVYHPSVCNVSLLYNTSSNWLAVVDTSGRCLSLPPFLFDRLMTHIPVDCPFALGTPAAGRLCSPRRVRDQRITLPALYFQLEDESDRPTRRLALPLERLVFRNESGAEELCVSRSDSDDKSTTADMMFSHIAFGSLTVAAFYTIIDLENDVVGFVPKADASDESTENFCAARQVCFSPMQIYFPPLNMCEDPDCSQYIFMRLDLETRTCRWTPFVPPLFGMILVCLAVFELVIHRMYKQAIQKASEHAQ